ncbi:hypothetical protein [Campylobacter sp. RM16187]|uniref:hypothetical protein n=1 Tax=Campylobacter sp. RM16187 TaxID=1660063 RepID=UPI0021B6B31B|nr:hypothetical protein [Campylobacter sp. RM16187]QKG29774.1 hypothetical protein CDOMF_1538 [Campylobacter sp. RM16187]
MVIVIAILRAFMANKSTKYLSDKDVRKLPIKNKNYVRVVSEPKELCIWVNPSGIKSFFILFFDSKGRKIRHKLNGFRPGVTLLYFSLNFLIILYFNKASIPAF